ncbi:hypothetical protein PF003_g41078 [Phytophthora fragariae]|nr:hypothetical protein PF003_g41078 [Phytophthora fragariae]
MWVHVIAACVAGGVHCPAAATNQRTFVPHVVGMHARNGYVQARRLIQTCHQARIRLVICLVSKMWVGR